MSTLPPGAMPIDDPSLVADGIPLESLYDQPGQVSALQDPERANAVTASAMESLDPHPLMRRPDNGVVDLPGGWRAPDGEVYTQALVRELTGRDEERLARIDPFQNTSVYLNTMLGLAVESIGSFTNIKEIVPSLLLGDREALLLGVRIATYGEVYERDIECPECRKQERVGIELSKDIPIRTLAEPGECEFDVPLRHGRMAHITLPTVALQDSILVAKEQTNAQNATRLLVGCVKTIDGVPADLGAVQDLGSADRRSIIEFMAEQQPGPDYEGVRLDCTDCGAEISVPISPAEFFL